MEWDYSGRKGKDGQRRKKIEWIRKDKRKKSKKWGGEWTRGKQGKWVPQSLLHPHILSGHLRVLIHNWVKLSCWCRSWSSVKPMAILAATVMVTYSFLIVNSCAFSIGLPWAVKKSTTGALVCYIKVQLSSYQCTRSDACRLTVRNYF